MDPEEDGLETKCWEFFRDIRARMWLLIWLEHNASYSCSSVCMSTTLALISSRQQRDRLQQKEDIPVHDWLAEVDSAPAQPRVVKRHWAWDNDHAYHVNKDVYKVQVIWIELFHGKRRLYSCSQMIDRPCHNLYGCPSLLVTGEKWQTAASD